MNLFTYLEVQKYDFQIDQKSRILTIGSCFSDVLGNFLIENKMEAVSNPFGNMYNPVSIFKNLKNSLSDTLPDQISYYQRDGFWFHHDFHSHISAESKAILHQKIQDLQLEIKDFLCKTDVLVITLGTSWIFKLENRIIANCHKRKASDFEKHLLTQNEIVGQFIELHQELNAQIPHLKILFSVSPVRHVKDGLIENNLSKSTLLLSINALKSQFSNVYYFPAYEFMLDQLRDYRFYKEDLIHPSAQAENAIIAYFMDCLANKNLSDWMKWMKQIRSNLNHKAFNTESTNHQNFLKKLLDEIYAKQEHADFESEIKWLKTQIL